MDTVGYVGTVEVETKATARLWFSLTTVRDRAEWVKIGAVRAWFTVNLEGADRPFFMAMLPVLMESMRAGLQVEASHEGTASFYKQAPNDTYEIDGVRVLRSGVRF